MSTTGKRIKELRKTLGLTQEQFAAAIHTSRSNLGNIETDTFQMQERMAHDVCREFNVRMEWLTDGEGEMFRERTRSEKVAAFIGEALADKPESFRRAFIEVTADFGPEDWVAIERIAKMFVDRLNKDQ